MSKKWSIIIFIVCLIIIFCVTGFLIAWYELNILQSLVILCVSLFVLCFVFISIAFIAKRIQKRKLKKYIKSIESEEISLHQTQSRESLMDAWTQMTNILNKMRIENKQIIPWTLFISMHDNDCSVEFSDSDTYLSSLAKSTDLCQFYFLPKMIVAQMKKELVSANRSKDWGNFLYCIKTTKRHISKVVISISAKEILNNKNESFEDSIRNLKIKLYELMLINFGKIKVFIVISACEKCEEFSRYTELLPEEFTDKYGIFSKNSSNIINFTEIINNINQSASKIVLDAKISTLDGHLYALSFLEFINKLTKASIDVTQSLFKSANYNQSIQFSGFALYGKSVEKSRGVFSDYVYNTLIPSSQHLTNTELLLNKFSIRGPRDFLFYTIVVLGSLLCIFVVGSYISTKNALYNFVDNVSQNIPPRDFISALIQTGNLYDESALVQDKASMWYAISFAKTAEQRFLTKQLSDNFSKHFEDDVLATLKPMIYAYPQNGPNLSPQILDGQELYTKYLIRSILIINGVLAHKTDNQMEYIRMPLSELANAMNPIFTTDIEIKYFHLYIKYARALSSEKLYELRTNITNELAKYSLQVNHFENIQNIINHNSNSLLSKITFATFFNFANSSTPENLLSVASIYTKPGEDSFIEFITDYAEAFGNTIETRQNIAEIIKTIKDNKSQVWTDFANQFAIVASKIKNPYDLSTNLKNLASSKGAYFLFFSKVCQEFPESNLQNTPDWIILSCLFNGFNPFQSTQKNPSMISQLKNKIHLSKVLKNEKTTSASIASNLNYTLQSQRLAQTYVQTLAQGIEALISQNQTLTMEQVTALYRNTQNLPNRSSSSAPNIFFNSIKAFTALKAQIGRDYNRNDAVFWNLLEGPISFMLYSANSMVAQTIETYWEQNILTQLNVTKDSNSLNEFFGKNGRLWEFVSKYTQPFLTYNGTSFVPSSFLGVPFPFNNEYIKFINTVSVVKRFLNLDPQAQLTGLSQSIEAVRAQPIDLFITLYPTNLNDANALVSHVEGSSLTLICSSSSQIINNLNATSTKAFKFRLSDCNEIDLLINLSTFTVTKQYIGLSGFSQFTKDFANSSHTFKAEDFTSGTHDLINAGIKTLNMKITFSGLSNFSAQLDNLQNLLNQKENTRGRLSALQQKFLDVQNLPSTIVIQSEYAPINYDNTSDNLERNMQIDESDSKKNKLPIDESKLPVDKPKPVIDMPKSPADTPKLPTGMPKLPADGSDVDVLGVN